MAKECGLYAYLWRPEECSEVKVAGDLIPFLKAGLEKLKEDPEHYKAFDAKNG